MKTARLYGGSGKVQIKGSDQREFVSITPHRDPAVAKDL
jgi:hypothetical protein